MFLLAYELLKLDPLSQSTQSLTKISALAATVGILIIEKFIYISNS